MTPAERLKEARKAMFFDSAAEAARTHGWPIPTYSHHENGTRAYGAEDALKYAEAYGVTPEWLVFGVASVASSIDDSARLQPVSRPTGSTEGAALIVTGPRIRLTFDREVSPAVARQILDLIEGEE